MSFTTLRMLVVVTLCTVPLTVLTVLLVVSAALPTHYSSVVSMRVECMGLGGWRCERGCMLRQQQHTGCTKCLQFNWQVQAWLPEALLVCLPHLYGLLHGFNHHPS